MKKIYKQKGNKVSLSDRIKAYKKETVSIGVLPSRKIQSKALAAMGFLAASAIVGPELQAQCTFTGTGATFPVDFDGDGVSDFYFLMNQVNGTGTNRIYVVGENGNGVVGTNAPFFSAVYPGTACGPCYQAGFGVLYSNYGTGYGNFAPGTTGFFPIVYNGGASTGFISITVNSLTSITINSVFNELINGEVPTQTGGVNGACNAIILPVEFASIKIETVEKKHKIMWSTASEINNKGFVVERSMDGSKFEEIGWIEGEGNSFSIKEYSFVDDKAKSNILYYYRLKQMDFDGNYEYSDIVSAKYEDKNALSLGDFAPNPARAIATLDVNIGVESNAQVILFDQLGNEILNKTQTLFAGSNTLNIELNDVPPATYFAKVIIGNEINYKRLVVVD